jgi:hypothetical protein
LVLSFARTKNTRAAIELWSSNASASPMTRPPRTGPNRYAARGQAIDLRGRWPRPPRRQYEFQRRRHLPGCSLGARAGTSWPRTRLGADANPATLNWPCPARAGPGALRARSSATLVHALLGGKPASRRAPPKLRPAPLPESELGLRAAAPRSPNAKFGIRHRYRKTSWSPARSTFGSKRAGTGPGGLQDGSVDPGEASRRRETTPGSSACTVSAARRTPGVAGSCVGLFPRTGEPCPLRGIRCGPAAQPTVRA